MFFINTSQQFKLYRFKNIIIKYVSKYRSGIYLGLYFLFQYYNEICQWMTFL